jgi:small multidrug resistance family-3 protein
LREKSAWWIGAAGACLLVGYGIVPTLQPTNFGSVYAAYGGVFVVLSLLWGWWIDGIRPDLWDDIDGLLCILGVAVMMYAPRG